MFITQAAKGSFQTILCLVLCIIPFLPTNTSLFFNYRFHLLGIMFITQAAKGSFQTILCLVLRIIPFLPTNTSLFLIMAFICLVCLDLCTAMGVKSLPTWALQLTRA